MLNQHPPHSKASMSHRSKRNAIPEIYWGERKSQKKVGKKKKRKKKANSNQSILCSPVGFQEFEY